VGTFLIAKKEVYGLAHEGKDKKKFLLFKFIEKREESIFWILLYPMSWSAGQCTKKKEYLFNNGDEIFVTWKKYRCKKIINFNN